ncbi:MAG: hypothetical protein J5911_04345 [Clostridia bacterium]|nr:hypothetical protein [Clostridia bacterium]
MLNIVLESEEGAVLLNKSIAWGTVILFAAIVAAFYLTFYVLRSIGIYKLAVRQGVDKPFFAFIPCIWIYTACKIIGKARFFGKTMESVAVWICVVFSCASIFTAVFGFLTYFPLVMYYLQGGEVTLMNSIIYVNEEEFQNLFDIPVINVIRRVIYYLNYLLRIGEIFVTVSVYIALFKKFWPEHYILASVLSFFGLFPIMVFAIRDREEVDFNEYIRNRFYGAGYTPYGNGGDRNNSRGTPYGNSSDDKNDPFGEFSNRPEEPFSEFDDNEHDDK